MLSFWEKKYWIDNGDIAVIGSGIVGLSTAIELRKKYPKRNVTIIEKGILPTGASTKNAGFACFGTVGEIMDDLNSMKESEIIKTIRQRWNGLNLLKENVLPQEMSYSNYGGSEVFESAKAYDFCFESLNYANKLIQEATGIRNCIAPKEQTFSNQLFSKMLFNEHESQINPVQLVKSLQRKAEQIGIRIISGIGVESFEEGTEKVVVFLDNDVEVTFNNLVFCTNAFTNNIFKTLDIIPARNQVILTEPLKINPIKGTFHMDKGYVYFRNLGSRILIGGARNIDSENEKTNEFGSNQYIQNYLKTYLESKILQKAVTIEYKWSGIIATGQSKKPIIERRSERTYIATRLGGMGVAIGSFVAKRLAEIFE